MTLTTLETLSANRSWRLRAVLIFGLLLRKLLAITTIIRCFRIAADGRYGSAPKLALSPPRPGTRASIRVALLLSASLRRRKCSDLHAIAIIIVFFWPPRIRKNIIKI